MKVQRPIYLETLSSDIDTIFSDRGCQVRVHPLSFAEYCSAMGVEDKLSIDVLGAKEKILENSEKALNVIQAAYDEAIGLFRMIRDKYQMITYCI